MSDQIDVVTIRVLSNKEIRERGLTGSDAWASVSVDGEEIALTNDYGTATLTGSYSGEDAENAVETLVEHVGPIWELALSKADPITEAHRAATRAIEKANDLSVAAATAKVRELWPEATAYAIAFESSEDRERSGSFYLDWVENEDEQIRIRLSDVDHVDHEEKFDTVSDIVSDLWTEGPLSGVEGWIVKLREEDIVDPSELNPTETSCQPRGALDPDDLDGLDHPQEAD